ncbi:MAG: hypothetical protein A2X79_01960 [Desulfuromonadaceae bacterium GWB2_53_15]|nr:MAG: hypothetical protein A2X79_01960 [Desulfuromonadaceae bacterium GWB2_53_15]
MRAATLALSGVTWIVIAMLVMPAGIMAQDAGDSDQDYRFSKEELTQMLAPIALYPDALTAQILMASTYPLEVVEADRWRNNNRQLKGNDLDNALQEKPWDPSVKSLCHFPDILAALSDKLDQTRKLGDAFLSQEEEVMATIQDLRRKALEQGNLNTTGEQKVLVEKEIIRIEPAEPEVIHVPVYDPAYVYGPWWYPAYPPYYWYYPYGYVSGAFIGFSPGIYFGFNWVWFDWPVRRIHVDVTRTRNFHRYYGRRDGTGPVWRHNPSHRKGVAYRDLRTSERFGSRPTRVSPTNPERRGYPGGRIERQNSGPTQVSPQRGGGQIVPPVRKEPAGSRGSEMRKEGAQTPSLRLDRQRTYRPEVRDTPFKGVGEGSFERKAGERGGISNRGIEMRQQSDGFRGGEMRRQEGGGSRGGGSRR